ncbi:dehydration-responsive element-binding protein 1E-like [Andrographis paniculata]|uniref:dehydration-responsive element-binding protein 1E-like n=1 Tax=Andrographis paniculata TaxID=175694 RepID=UPI0021E81F95|nr:dehydration-responsive element-binding protein 1E-like [Andrographis paniculata]
MDYNALSNFDFPGTSGGVAAAEEQVMLAESRPKKRAGRKKFKETRHPVYRGVRRRDANKWVCELREPTKQKRVWLGTYPTPEMAARAHDVAALALRGQMACLNFADSMWRLPVPASTEAKDLRKAAVEAAKAFGPGAGEEACEGREAAEAENSESQEMYDGSLYGDFGVGALAEAALLSPPPCVGWKFSWDDEESDAEVQLWSF